MKNLIKRFYPFLTILALLFAHPVLANEWQVIPIRLDLDRATKSGVLTIKNRGDIALNVQIKAFEWSQDANGKDQYSETADLIFLPRIATIEKQADQLVRAAIKVPATAREKTYRLFIEEIPKARKAESTGVAIAVRFGVPIFVKPLKEEIRGEIVKMELAKGVLSATVKNTGNIHFNTNSLVVRMQNSKGEEVFTKDIKGWYLLSDISRDHAVPIPEKACLEAVVAEIEVKADKLNLKRRLDLKKTMCMP
jgi:fimbrial chaperone protein